MISWILSLFNEARKAHESIYQHISMFKKYPRTSPTTAETVRKEALQLPAFNEPMTDLILKVLLDVRTLCEFQVILDLD